MIRNAFFSDKLKIFDMLLGKGGGGQELDVPLVVHPLRWFFCLLGQGPSILFLVFPLFWVLWFISDSQGFIKIVLKIHV